MTDDLDFKKFYTDLIEYIPIATIRREMKEGEELSKFTDSHECKHIAFDETKMTDRDLEIFSDDLFKYLFPRRLKITTCNQVKRTLEDPVSKFHPHIGMSILLCSFHIQKDMLGEFAKFKLKIQNTDLLARYFTNKVILVYSRDQYNIFQKLGALASILLELIAFCYRQGNRNTIPYGARLYFFAFQHVFKNDFYTNGGWNAWKDFVSRDAEFYIERNCETIDENTQIACIPVLMRYDQWIASLPLKTGQNQTESKVTNNESDNQSEHGKNAQGATSHNQIESKVANNESDNQSEHSKNAQGETSNIMHDLENLSGSGIQLRDSLQCLFLKDCPVAKYFQTFSNSLIQGLITVISRKRDLAYEELYQILEKDTCVEKLMGYCVFSKMIIRSVRNPEIKVRNIDILQIVKLFLRDNVRKAVSCFHLVFNKMPGELHKAKSFNQNHKETIHDMTTENRQETGSSIESVEHLSSKESPSSVHPQYKTLIDSFLLIIKNDGSCTTAGSKICEIFSDVTKSKILCTSETFILLMRATVSSPEDRWEDDWILSIIREILISKENEKILLHLSTVAGAQKPECTANDFPVVHIHPTLIESIQTGETITDQSLKSENFAIDLIFNDGTDAEERLPLNLCEQCVSSIKENLRLIEFYSTSVEMSVPENEIEQTEEQSLKKRNSNENRIAHETSVDKETSSSTKTSETAATDLPSPILHSEDTSNDIKEASTSTSEKAIDLPPLIYLHSEDTNKDSKDGFILN